jgi:hypothetical protein
MLRFLTVHMAYLNIMYVCVYLYDELPHFDENLLPPKSWIHAANFHRRCKMKKRKEEEEEEEIVALLPASFLYTIQYKRYHC